MEAPKITSLSAGQSAPAFCLPDSDLKQACLSDAKGKWLVLYFYPKDNTSGCTLESIAFSKLLPRFESRNALIWGVSPDSVKSHCNFRDKHALTVRLLSDEDHAVATTYGVWRQKQMYGRKYFGIFRSTFLISPARKIVRAYYGVSPDGHAQEVLADLEKEFK